MALAYPPPQPHPSQPQETYNGPAAIPPAVPVTSTTTSTAASGLDAVSPTDVVLISLIVAILVAAVVLGIELAVRRFNHPVAAP